MNIIYSKTCNKPKIKIIDLVVHCINNFEYKEFSLHDITKKCREECEKYDITDLPLRKDPNDNKMKAWIYHAAIKKLAIPILDIYILKNIYEVNFNGTYRTFQKINTTPKTTTSSSGNSIFVNTNATPSNTVSTKSVKSQIYQYLCNKYKANEKTTLHNIQKRIKSQKVSIKEIQKICDELFAITENRGAASRQTIIYLP